MGGMNRLLFVGAEAEVRLGRFLGKAVVVKARKPKLYRSAELDARIRKERLRSEAALLSEARKAGVAAPEVLDIDHRTGTLRMRHVQGPTLREVLARTPRKATNALAQWGRMIGRLHEAGIVHGDLTTSNAILENGRVVLIDFGLASRSRDVEDRGVDLLLVERTLASTHPRTAKAWLRRVLTGYRATYPRAGAAIGRMHEIRGRARYA